MIPKEFFVASGKAIREMAKIRETEISEINYRFESLRVPMDNYGCVVAALVYIP